MGRTTGRVAQARELLLEASRIANETGQHVVGFKMASRSMVTAMRQCCYAAQRGFINQVIREAESDGKDPELYLRATLLDGHKGEFVDAPPAIWPTASISYKYAKGSHYIIFQFRRIASDPLWRDMLKENMVVGMPEDERLSLKDIVEEIK